MNGVQVPIVGEFGNPVLTLDQNDNEAQLQSLFSSASIDWSITNDLKLTTSAAYLKRNNEIRQFAARYDFPTQSFTRLQTIQSSRNFPRASVLASRSLCLLMK